MAWLQVSKSDSGKTWRAEIRRPLVSATVWELVAPDAIFRTAGEARAHLVERYGLSGDWQRTNGRGSTYYRTSTNGARHNDALPVRFIVDSCDEITAIFPTLSGSSDDDYTCYAHIGQHGSASPEWANSRNHRDASPDERAPLYRELQGIYEGTHQPIGERSTLFVVDDARRPWMVIQRIDSYGTTRK